MNPYEWAHLAAVVRAIVREELEAHDKRKEEEQEKLREKYLAGLQSPPPTNWLSPHLRVAKENVEGK